MRDELRRRNTRRGHYQVIEKTIIFGYLKKGDRPALSDGARRLWLALDAFDFVDSVTGMSKGYSFPKQPTLAELLGISTRTVQRHIAELVDFELLTVEVITTRKGRRNIYWIEDPSEEEFDAYLNLWNQTIQADQADEEAQEGDDKNVATPMTTKMSSPPHGDKNVVTHDDKSVATPKRPKGAPPKGLRGEKSSGRIKNVKNKEEQSARASFSASQPKQKPDWVLEMEAATAEVAVAVDDDPSSQIEEPVHNQTAVAVMEKPEEITAKNRSKTLPVAEGSTLLDGLATRDSNFAKVCEIWRRRVGMMGPTQHQKLEFWFVEQGMSAELLDMVLDVSVMRAGEVRPWGYLEKILRDWMNLGALDQAGVYEKEPATISDLRRAGFDYPPVEPDKGPKAVEGVANASAYQRVDHELVEKWKAMYPDEYDE